MSAPLPTELVLLGWSVALLFVHVMLQAQLATRERGIAWNAGSRDETPKAIGRHAGRAERALWNFRETYPVFIALALGLAVAERTGGIGSLGAWVWFLARVAYLPLYIFGIAYIRSVCWLISLIGLLLMLIRFL